MEHERALLSALGSSKGVNLGCDAPRKRFSVYTRPRRYLEKSMDLHVTNTSIFTIYIANELEIMLFIILSILTVPMSGKKKSSSAACLVSMRVAGSRSSIFANRSGLLGYLFSTYCLREQ